MNYLLIKCPHCKKIYKVECRPLSSENVRILRLVTDFGDIFDVNISAQPYITKCLSCDNTIELNSANSIKTEDWIANLFFTVKGN